jgi:hypothetical protein
MSKENNVESQPAHIENIESGDDVFIIKDDECDHTNPDNYNIRNMIHINIRCDKLIAYIYDNHNNTTGSDVVTKEVFSNRVKTENQMEDIHKAWETKTPISRQFKINDKCIYKGNQKVTIILDDNNLNYCCNIKGKQELIEINEKDLEPYVPPFKVGDTIYTLKHLNITEFADSDNPNNYDLSNIYSIDVGRNWVISIEYYKNYDKQYDEEITTRFFSEEEVYKYIKTEDQMEVIQKAWKTETLIVKDSTETIILGNCILTACHEDDIDALIGINNKCFKHEYLLKDMLTRKYGNQPAIFNYAGCYCTSRTYKDKDLVICIDELAITAYYARRDVEKDRAPHFGSPWIKADSFKTDKNRNIKSISIHEYIINNASEN